MRKVLLNKQALTGYTIYQTAPVGAVFDFAGVDIPNGFLPCDGRAISRTEFSELFKVIGTLYGKGDGSTTFNLPNTFKKVIEGADAQTIGKVYEAGIPNIKSEITNTDSYGSVQMHVPTFKGALSGTLKGAASWSGSTVGSYELSFDASKGETKIDGTLKSDTDKKVYGKSDTVQMDAVGMFKIIKVKSYMLDNPEGRSEKPVYEVPIGTILESSGNIAPTGYLICDGNEYSRELYADLFSVIGTKYGSGNGQTTFNLPLITDKMLPNVEYMTGRRHTDGRPLYKIMFIDTNNSWSTTDNVVGSVVNFKEATSVKAVARNYSMSGWVENNEGGSARCYCYVKDNGEVHFYRYDVTDGTAYPKKVYVDYTKETDTENSLCYNQLAGNNFCIKALKTTAQPSSDIEIDDTKTTNANVWSAQHTMDILGFEMGSNENGDYRKWANGIIEQWGSTTTIANAGKPINFPIPMKTIKFANVTGNSIFPNSGKSRGGYDELTTSGMKVAYIGGNNQTLLADTVYWTVVGTWK